MSLVQRNMRVLPALAGLQGHTALWPLMAMAWHLHACANAMQRAYVMAYVIGCLGCKTQPVASVDPSKGTEHLEVQRCSTNFMFAAAAVALGSPGRAHLCAVTRALSCGPDTCITQSNR
jgi:hypothetical protein